MKEDIVCAYRILDEVYRKGAYTVRALNDTKIAGKRSALVTKIVYSVLSLDVRLEMIISQKCKKKPKASVIGLLKIGIYLILFSDIPAAVSGNSVIEAAKMLGKSGVTGFLNAIMNALNENDRTYSGKDAIEEICFICSKPKWLVEKLVADFGKEKAIALLKVRNRTMEHIRPNLRKLNANKLETILDRENVHFEKSPQGYFVQNCDAVQSLFKEGKITVQSLCSAVIAAIAAEEGGVSALDVCAAPGGKSEYLSQCFQTVTACDVHPHRLELMNRYFLRMGAENIKIESKDGSEFEPMYENAFDVVLADVPCSGLGVCDRNPDILLTISQQKIDILKQLQINIVKNAVRYVKKGGLFVYSTCSYTKEETEDIADMLTKEATLEEVAIKHSLCENKSRYLFTGENGTEGYFVAKFKKI